MRFRKPKINYGDRSWDTYIEIDGVEHDVKVTYYTSPAEPDVNHAGDCEITGVYFEDEGDITSKIPQADYDALQERLVEYENDRCNPDNYDYPEY